MRKAGLILAVAVIAAFGTFARAQGSKTVDAGVYSDVQATRGAAAYDQICGRCHRADLGGADGPALKEDRFNRNFAGKDLRTLYGRMSTTMPRGAPGSLSEGAYLDILAYVLRENGFPAGSHELSVDALEGVQVLPTRPKPLPAVGDFSYVEVVGCLVPGDEGGWMLTRGGDPIATIPPGMTTGFGPPNAPIAPTSLGNHTYSLVDAMAYNPAALNGHKMRVRGLLIRMPSEERITISDVKSLSSSCQ